ncbi:MULTISPECIES: NAD(P)-dependent oxidoreductase [Rhodopseudomonas]|uniref:NAD-dependent epimerase/dehydratase domain-containing protein n=1 Tax=Rhodopseudomonas palustris TaxID=1076 RepID=A0A0D7F7C1_RHOPL|nr:MULTISPECIES: NAD(P)-dependent oxidoreductase [Rhodopseudomonas]KIZ47617.1 hypothetical protein OO17_03395 [Rhodopseudomonas palustris]MDF3808880.1 NAD(P)-dependent oxidoreductase [Rhodopseudomonas sp. BAL398]WOK15837.1 NAD(P)-dependent oxidoreductase [Rhodopseudomonas sp. BAL398]
MSDARNIDILVTGATGFIGSSLLEPLARDGARLRAGVRQVKPAAAATAQVQSYPCDLDNPDQLRAAVAGTDIVVHTAYRSIAAMPDQCRRLLAAMSAAGTANLVYFSSIAVYGSAAGHVGEDTPPHGDPGSYGLAKRQCEESIRQWVAEQPQTRRAVILRPGIVYGAHSQLWVDKMIARIRCGAWGTFGSSGEGMAALIHIDDVAAITAQACARLAQDSQNLPGVTIVNAVGPETPSWNAYFRALAAADAQPALRDLSQVELALRMAVAMAAKVWRKAGLPGAHCAALAPTPSELRLFALRADYATDKAEAAMGFKAGIGLQDGLRRTLSRR